MENETKQILGIFVGIVGKFDGRFLRKNEDDEFFWEKMFFFGKNVIGYLIVIRQK